jgi:hypothetical protein
MSLNLTQTETLNGVAFELRVIGVQTEQKMGFREDAEALLLKREIDQLNKTISQQQTAMRNVLTDLTGDDIESAIETLEQWVGDE